MSIYIIHTLLAELTPSRRKLPQICSSDEGANQYIFKWKFILHTYRYPGDRWWWVLLELWLRRYTIGCDTSCLHNNYNTWLCHIWHNLL